MVATNLGFTKFVTQTNKINVLSTSSFIIIYFLCHYQNPFTRNVVSLTMFIPCLNNIVFVMSCLHPTFPRKIPIISGLINFDGDSWKLESNYF